MEAEPPVLSHRLRTVFRRAGAVSYRRPFSLRSCGHGGPSRAAQERGGPRGETHGFSHLSPRFRPYTPMRGSLSNVWYDRYKISNDCPEHIETIDSMCQALTGLIDDEVKNGIGKNRILLGGFSMGGGMAMHLAYRHHQEVAGVFALSSFLNKNSAIYQSLKKIEREPPELFQCHGTADELVLYSWGEETNKMLKSLGVVTTFLSLPNLYHELNKSELEKLQAWILKKLPEQP
ncbi:lysophospholipase-like protein 1 isoform X1 [Rhineura floridana]|uniref:lysophospholipase-like protein 1 isoform X1 n=1 Tax=Rhineura floridana TaxID=261503 RepID=UPI002AC8890A|nr:lysophospholipase-like protein 1 isoform X1 [Rhineura floridana]